jgi:two-component system cell cycle response regulator DivK
VIEDNRLNYKLFYDLLTAYGATVIGLHRAEEAYIKACQLLPDIIIMDIELPGMSGIDSILAMRRDPALESIPIIAVTALAMGSDVRRIWAAGCSDYVTKPISITPFLETIYQALQKKRRLSPSDLTLHSSQLKELS